MIAEMTDFSIGVRERACERCGELQHEEQEPQPTYRKGDRGDGVKNLQEALNAGGFNCGAADGIFGKKTEAAVKAVEQAHDFEPDGIAWPGVQKWLGMVGGMGPDDDAPLPDGINSTYGGGNPSVPIFEDTGEVFSVRRFVVTDIPDWDSAFYDGADVKVELRLTIDNYSSYKLEGFGLGYAEDAFANEWTLMGMTLSAGESYDFTYHMRIKEAPESWNTRAATVYLRNQQTGMLEQETVEFGPTWRPAKVSLGHESGTSKPTLTLTVDKKDYMSRVYAGDTIDIPIRVGIEGPELAEVRNLMLTIKQVNTDHNEVFKTDEFKLKNKYMGTDEDFGYLAQVMATIPVPTYIEPRALRLQLSGTYTDKKGKSKVVESEVVSLAYNPSIKDKESPGISLDYYVTPWKNLYGPGDRVTVHMTVKNVGPEPVELFGMRFIGPNKEILSKLDDIQDVPAQTILTTGATADASWSYTIQKEDCDAASMEADVHVRGMLLKDGRTIFTPSIHVSIPCREILPEFLSLTAQVQEERPLYTPGMTVPVRLTLSDTTNRRLTRTRIYATGDNQKSGILSERIWHDFGHGASGYMIGDMGAIDYKYKTMVIDVTIPEDFTGDAFRASWVAEGDYVTENRSARSNVATIQLPIMQASDEEAELSLKVELRSLPPREAGFWIGGDVADVRVSADYLGSGIAKRLIIEGADASGKQPFTLSAENSNHISDTVHLTLDKGELQGGSHDFVFRALANVEDADTTDYMTAEHILKFNMTPLDKGQIVVSASIISESTHEDGKWQSGDKAFIRVEASYDGPVMPPRRIDYSAYSPGSTEAPVAHSDIWYADTIVDEFEVQLDSHDAVNDEIVYTITAYVCEGESEVYTCEISTEVVFEMSPTATGPDADGPSAGGMGADLEDSPAFIHAESISIDTGHTSTWEAEESESPTESGAGGEVAESPAESGSGNEAAESPAESGADGEAIESPA
ncbi:MAG: peptidoglycan-binding domain-containing protein, partial [Clostridia bacterium]|nr:peptidoglycan-binding domain-containing protein [Clostridia bacterium]